MVEKYGTKISNCDIRPGGRIAADRVWTEFFGVEASNGKIM